LPVLRSVVPAACLAAILAAGPLVAAAVRAADEIIVQAGDTLSGISKRHGVTVSTLVAANALADPNRIFIGQRLRTSTTAPATAPAPGPAAPAGGRTHTVARGDNLWSIARFYGVSLSALVAANGIGNSSRIGVGLQLVIPGAAPSAPAPPPPPAAAPVPAPAPAPAAPQAGAARTHTVARGDNLWSIARFYGVSLSALVAANGIGNSSRIGVGLQLVIPGAAPSAPAPPPPPAAAPVPAPAPAPAAVTPPAISAWMAAVIAQRDAMRQIIVEEATSGGVPVALALAVAWQESGWRQNVVSSAGAVGVMQLMPGTARWIGEAMLGRVVDINDARDNVRAGVRLLAHYLARYGGNRELALAAYYQGQGAVDRHGVYPVSRPYIAAIAALERLFGG